MNSADGRRIGHPILFPNILARRNVPTRANIQIRAPIDDEHTLH